jgi:transcriptional regulatory protein AMDR
LIDHTQRNLEESDVPPLERRHFEGIPHAEVDFAIQHTDLCIVFSEAMRKRVSIRSSAADRARATKQADQRLAEFITNLPEQLQLSLTELDTWQATLHLSYNNFLILLHRPLPWKEQTESNPDPIGDLHICSDAVVAIVSIFEGLRRRGYLGNLWLPSIYTLFTAMVYITRELDSVNPVVAAKSSRMFDSLLLTLRELSQHWLYAQSLIRLFENRDWWKKKQGQGAGDNLYHPLEENSEQSVNLNVQAAPPELHRELMANGPGQGNTRLSERNTAPGQTTLDAHRPEELLNGWAYDPLRTDNVDVATGIGDPWDMMTLPSDLELFLAGIGNEYNY